MQGGVASASANLRGGGRGARRRGNLYARNEEEESMREQYSFRPSVMVFCHPDNMDSMSYLGDCAAYQVS